MNGFLRGVMSTMLGWLSLLFSSVWGVLSGQENLVSFIGKNWKGLVLALCLMGTAIDLTVYFFRWKPWRVWQSFWQRLRNPVRPGMEPAPAEQRAAAQLPPEPGDPWADGGPGRDERPFEPQPATVRHRRSRRSRPEADTYHDPYYPPQWQEPGMLGTQRRSGE